MQKKSKKNILIIWITILFLSIIACGNVQVGVVATPQATKQVDIEIQATKRTVEDDVDNQAETVNTGISELISYKV